MVNRSKVIEMAKALSLQALATTRYILNLKDEDIVVLKNAFAFELNQENKML